MPLIIANHRRYVRQRLREINPMDGSARFGCLPRRLGREEVYLPHCADSQHEHRYRKQTASVRFVWCTLLCVGSKHIAYGLA